MDKFLTDLLNQKASGGSTTLEDFQAKFKSLAESRGWDVVQDSSKLDELEKLRIIHTGNPMPSGPGSLISAFYTPENQELIDIQSKLMASDPRDLSEVEANRLLARREELAVGAKYKTTIAAPEQAIEDLIFKSPRHTKLAEMINKDPATREYKTNIMKSLITFHEGMEAYYFPKGFEKHDLWSGNIAIQNTYGTHVSPRVIKSEFAVAEKMGKDALELLIQYRKDELEGGISGFGTAKPERYEKFLQGIIGNYENKLKNIEKPQQISIPQEKPFVPQVRESRRPKPDNTLTRTKKKIEERRERIAKKRFRLGTTPFSPAEFNKKLNLPLDYLSVSQIELYNKCPRQYYFRYIENIQPPSRMDMAFGKAMHSAAEFTHRNIVEHGAPAATEAVQDIFSKAFEKELESANVFPGEDIVAERQRGLELAKQYNETVAPKVKPLKTGLAGKPWIERHIKYEIADVPMVGVIDLVDVADKKKGPVIADLKTLVGEKTQSELSESLQMAFYSKATGYKNTRYDVLSRDAENVHISRVENKPSYLDYERLEEKVRDTASKISERKFPVCKGKKSCSAYECPYFSICKREKTPPKIANTQIERENVEQLLKRQVPEQELEQREAAFLEGLEKDFKARFKGPEHNYLKTPIKTAEPTTTSLFKKIPKFHLVAAGAGALWLASQFSGKDDAYNTIEGLPHGGMAEQQRKMLTDFGSGYTGIVKLPERLQKLVPNIAGLAGPLEEHIALFGQEIIKSKSSIFEKAMMGKDLALLVNDLSKSKFKHSIWINTSNIKRSAEASGGKFTYGELLKGVVRHEKFHQKVVQEGAREDIAKLSSLVPQEFKVAYEKSKFGASDKLAEEYLAYTRSFQKSKRPPLFSFGTNLFSGKDDAYNTIEGLGHKGLASKLRKFLTDFGSGFQGLLKKSYKEIAENEVMIFGNWTSKQNQPIVQELFKRVDKKLQVINKDKIVDPSGALIGQGGPHFGAYSPKNNLVIVDNDTSVSVIAHELGHAATMKDSVLSELSVTAFKGAAATLSAASVIIPQDRNDSNTYKYGVGAALVGANIALSIPNLKNEYDASKLGLKNLQELGYQGIEHSKAFYKKAFNTYLKHTIVGSGIIAGIWGGYYLFAGGDKTKIPKRGDSINPIEGMPHGGKGGELRNANTDHGSKCKEFFERISLKISNLMTKGNKISSRESLLSKYLGTRQGFNLALNPQKAAQYAKETSSIEAFAKTLGIENDIYFAKTKQEAIEMMKNLDISDRSREAILEMGSMYHSRINKIFLVEESLKDWFKNERNIILKDQHMQDTLKTSLYHEYLEKSTFTQMGSNIQMMPGGHVGTPVVAGEAAFLQNLKNRKVTSVFKSIRTTEAEKEAWNVGRKMFKGENNAINTIDGLPKEGRAALENHIRSFFGSKFDRIRSLKSLMSETKRNLKNKRAAKSLYLSSKNLKIAQKQIWSYANGMAGKGHSKYAGSHVKQLSHFGGI